VVGIQIGDSMNGMKEWFVNQSSLTRFGLKFIAVVFVLMIAGILWEDLSHPHSGRVNLETALNECRSSAYSKLGIEVDIGMVGSMNVSDDGKSVSIAFDDETAGPKYHGVCLATKDDVAVTVVREVRF
jgi:hypothetical protein